MKYISFYLPQYHTIEENDNWWGKGFTEWVRVKKSKPIFSDHYQPRIPYKYYDLKNKEDILYQIELAKTYGIYGFCFYHYWFNGQKLLEKPVETILEDKNLNFPFCFAWANEPWTRAWEGKSKEILMPQNYGNESSWENHIKYLIHFFKDERYIKINERPLFLIYRSEAFKRFDSMIKFWNEVLNNNGLKSLYIIEMLTSYQKKPCLGYSEAVVEFEPMFTIGRGHSFSTLILNKIRKQFSFFQSTYKLFDYDKIWRKILNRNTNYSKILFAGAFTDWDNSPRFGKKAAIFVNSNPQKFYKYLKALTIKTKSDFIFINAWNEWAEGAYLEPDSKFGVQYLESIKRIINESIS